MNGETFSRPVEILLVEDNPGDARLVQEAFKEGRLLNRVHVVEDGMDALAFLRQHGEYAHAPRPDLILLDLILPKKSGLEVLAEIKADHDLKRIPVVVMTASEAEADVVRSYDLNANCVISKSVDLYQFVRRLKSVGDFWLAVAELPPT